MARKTRPSEEANEYIYIDGETTASAYVGTEQDKVYRSDPDWSPVGTPTLPPEEEGMASATPHSGKTKSDGGRTHAADLEGLSREDLNALATEKGVENPEGFANKDEVKTAILAATHGVDEDE
jgi:hypothetical protein